VDSVDEVDPVDVVLPLDLVRVGGVKVRKVPNFVSLSRDD
jgi:hypothetical protein